jgi:excisionase family DNA binding protein
LKAEFTFPQELAAEIADKVCEKLKPISSVSDKQDDDIFDVKSLSQYLKVSTQWIYERTHLKEIPHIKKQGLLRFRKREIDKWLDSDKIPAIESTGILLKAANIRR